MLFSMSVDGAFYLKRFEHEKKIIKKIKNFFRRLPPRDRIECVIVLHFFWQMFLGRKNGAKNFRLMCEGFVYHHKNCRKMHSKKEKNIVLGAKLLYELVFPSWLWLWFIRYDFYVFLGGFRAFKFKVPLKQYIFVYKFFFLFDSFIRSLNDIYHLYGQVFPLYCITMAIVYNIFCLSSVCLYICLLC